MLLRVIAVEAQIARDGFAIEREAAAGERAGAERQHIGPAARFAEPFAVAREHLEIREQVVRPEHRLGAPHMRVAGNDSVRDTLARARAASCMTPASSSRARSHSSRSHSRVSSETCSFRLRPVWILSASAPTFSFSLRMTKVWTSSSAAPSKNPG